MQGAHFQVGSAIAAEASPSLDASSRDELSREVFGVLGVPIDPIGVSDLLEALEAAVESREPFLLSTPNVNFLVTSQIEPAFRESLLSSDLCPVDGMPIVWIARLLGVPIKHRLSGADLFEALKAANTFDRRLRVFLFGGADDVAARVGNLLNAQSRGLKCVGALNPGFGAVEDMSGEKIIRTINASGADILAIFLNAKKAQAWLLQNHDYLTVPIRGQFGATINFEAGTVRRAPPFLRSIGLEWLWRIWEEPYLWRRYLSDGKKLLPLVLIRTLPLAVALIWNRSRTVRTGSGLQIEMRENDDSIVIRPSGPAIAAHVGQAIGVFRTALSKGKAINVDVSRITLLDPRFFGLLLMVRKQLRKRGRELRFTEVSPPIRRTFRRNGFEFLLSN